MALHTMNLNPAPFEMIRDGRKTLELRLYDEKRRRIKIGDTIRFENTQTGETLTAAVMELHVFDSFTALYQALPLLECGYTEETVSSAKPDDMDAYYSKEEQRQYGVVGIRLKKEVAMP